VIGCLTIAHFTLLRCAAPKPRYWPGSCDGHAKYLLRLSCDKVPISIDQKDV
jgi:hypothetical protein